TGPGALVANGDTFANGINDADEVVGAVAAPGAAYQGYIYQSGTFKTFSDPNAGTQAGQGTLANGINNEGVIVGNYVDSSGRQHGFVYTGSLMTINSNDFTTIDDPLGVGGTEIYGINDAGQIVGGYTDGSGTEHGFVASLNGTAVNEGGSVVLPSITATPVDSDDVLTLTIAGLPAGATITDSADSTAFSGSSITLTGSEVGSTLTLHDGSNESNFSLTVSANNTTAGEAASSASQNIAVMVNPVAPALTAPSSLSVNEDGTVALGISETPFEPSDPVTITITG